MPIAIEFFVGHAYAILFLWVLIEQLGIPIPSIPLLLTAGTLSATHRVGAIPSLLAVVAACLISDSAWYALGRRYGGRVIRLLCRLSLESSTCVPRPKATSPAVAQLHCSSPSSSLDSPPSPLPSPARPACRIRASSPSTSPERCSGR